MSFDTLTDDVLLHIIGHIGHVTPAESSHQKRYHAAGMNESIDYEQRARTLSRLSLASRRLRDLVEPHLYSTFTQSNIDQLACFARSIHGRATLANHVRELFVEYDVEDVKDAALWMINGADAQLEYYDLLSPATGWRGGDFFTEGELRLFERGMEQLRGLSASPQSWGMHLDHVQVNNTILSDTAAQQWKTGIIYLRWDSLVAIILMALRNIQAIYLGNWALWDDTSNYIANVVSRASRCDSILGMLKHVELHHKETNYDGSTSLMATDDVVSVFSIKSLHSLHLRAITFEADLRDWLQGASADFVFSIKELKFTNCAINSQVLSSLVSLCVQLERFTYKDDILSNSYMGLSDLGGIPSSLLPACKTLKEIDIITVMDYTYELDPKPHNRYEHRAPLSSLEAFTALTTLGIDAPAVMCTKGRDAQAGRQILSRAVQPCLEHLTLYRCDFPTYSRIAELAESKAPRGLRLRSITLRFAENFPHWPSVIDPVRSMVSAEVRENLANQTMAIEREYDEYRGQGAYGRPASWLEEPGARVGRLVPTKEKKAREACEATGISLHVQSMKVAVRMNPLLDTSLDTHVFL